MADGWPAVAVVLFACAAAPLLLSAPAEGGSGVTAAAADDDGPRPQPSASSWCLKKECKCADVASADRPSDDNDDAQRPVSVRCTYTGEKNVTLEQDKNLTKALVELALSCDGRCKLIVWSKTFAAYNRLRSFAVAGFDEVRVKRQGLHVRNELSDFSVSIARVRTLSLETNAVQPYTGTVDVLIEDCGVVQLGSEVIAKLRSFVFRRIDSLELSENTFKYAAAENSVIEKVILENVTADKLPSRAFVTTIDRLSVTNCTFGSIEPQAFPVMSMENATFTDVAVGRVAGEAFQPSAIITNLRIIGCRVREMERNAVASVVQRIHVERSEFGSVSTSAVTVSNELVLYNNRFKRVAGRGFVLNNLHSVRVDGNTFGWLEPEAFYESSPANRQDRSVLRVRDNEFAVNNGSWSPTVRLQKLATETDVAGNRFVGSPSSCGCGPWLFVAVAADDSNGTPANGDYRFLDRNYCKTNALSAVCANLTTAAATATHQEFPIGVFTKAAGCGGPTAAVYERCVKERAAGGGGFRLFGGTFTPDAERGIITTVVLLVLCGFGAVCAVSAITWLNARGYFIKLRSLLTANGTGGDGNGRGGMMARTMSAHSLSPMSVHEYAELQRNKLGGSGGNVPTGSDVGAVRVIVFQDKGTQTVPEELTHEMLQSLRDKLDDPEDYAEARGMIEHLYDLIRVEETCCRGGGGGGGGWYSVGGLDDMTSTITTKAVTVGQQGRGEPGHDVKSVGTGVPSLDRLWPPRINVQAAANREVRYEPVAQQQAEQRPPPPRPSVGEYMDPADLYGTGRKRDDEDNGDDADIYCELADLRGDAAEYRRPRSQPPTPPPVPDKPTEV